MIDPPKTDKLQQNQDKADQSGTGPKDADAHAMKALLNKKEGAGELSSIFSSQSKQAIEESKKGQADALEKRLKKYQQNQESGQEKEKQHDSDETDAQDLAQEVAEHILVSDQSHMIPGSDNEVRIKIRESILKDAHVHLVREKDSLEVKLISTNKYSVQTLVAASDSLENQLKQNYKGKIHIQIIHLNPKGDAHTVKND